MRQRGLAGTGQAGKPQDTALMLILLFASMAVDRRVVPDGIAALCIAILLDRKSTLLNSSHTDISRMPSSA